MITNPIFHDLVKSTLCYKPNDCLSKIRAWLGYQKVKKSRMFGYDWEVKNTRQEYFGYKHTWEYPLLFDCVWKMGYVPEIAEKMNEETREWMIKNNRDPTSYDANDSRRLILHEVKTGKLVNGNSLNSIYNKYSGCAMITIGELIRNRNRGYQPYSRNSARSFQPIIIWAWNKYIDDAMAGSNEEVHKALKVGALRVYPIDLIQPIVFKTVKEFQEQIQSTELFIY